jgi:hypothetical protein
MEEPSMRDLEQSEPVHIAPKMWVVASENDTFRVLRTEQKTDIEHELSVSYRSSRTVRALLNGALYAAFTTQGRHGKPQPVSAIRLAYMLAGSYHHLQTPPRLARAAATFRCLKRDNIAAFLELKVSEEAGHDHLALQDLTALGLPAERIVEVLRPPVSLQLLGLLDDYSRTSYPIAVLGYTFCMERLAIFYGEEEIGAYQQVCPPGADATRCLRVHSGVGADDEHVDEVVDFITTLDKRDVASIVAATFETASVMVDALLDDATTTDADIASRLQHAGITLPFAA